MNETIETVEYKGYHINIEHDFDPQNPRTEWDNIMNMLCFHSRYNLGDTTDLKSDMFDGWDEVEKHLIEEEGAVLIRPLYLYDHSGITISMSEFSCSWDSGCIGFIYLTKEKMQSVLGWKRLTEKRKAKAIEYMKGEVETYDDYLTGEVYGFNIEETDDSCWGFYGYDHDKSGLLEHAQNSIDCEIECKKKKHFEKIKTWIKNKVPFQYRCSLSFG